MSERNEKGPVCGKQVAPSDISPAHTREPFSWSFPEYENPDPALPGRFPRKVWSPEERIAYEARVDWFYRARYGIVFHYLACGAETPREWNEWVDAVDVEKVAEQAKAIGAGYVVISLGQNSVYSCAPNPVIDANWRRDDGLCTSRRDLPMDLWKALDRRGIPMMLYIATDHHYRMPRRLGMGDTEAYKTWIDVARWYSDHYGTRCRGWWVDGLLEFIPGYRMDITRALRHGNPEALVASGHYEISDFLHGHCMEDWERQRRVVKPYYGRWDVDFNIQWHVLQYIGPTWGAPGCNKAPAQLVRYATEVVRGGGVITFDLGTFSEGCFYKLPEDAPNGKLPDGSRIGPFLEIQPDQFAILESVREALKDIRR